MAVYYISACHDCKEKVMWLKTSKEQAEKWHENFHKNHNKELGHDLDDDFYDSVSTYKNLGIKDG